MSTPEIIRDERIDRLVEATQRTNVLLEGLRISIEYLMESRVDHEQRLRSVEQWKQNLTPILAILTFLSGVVFSEMIQRLL